MQDLFVSVGWCECMTGDECVHLLYVCVCLGKRSLCACVCVCVFLSAMNTQTLEHPPLALLTLVHLRPAKPLEPNI